MSGNRRAFVNRVARSLLLPWVLVCTFFLIFGLDLTFRPGNEDSLIKSLAIIFGPAIVVSIVLWAIAWWSALDICKALDIKEQG